MQLRNGKSTKNTITYDVFWKIFLDENDPSKGYYIDGEASFDKLSEAIDYFVDASKNRLDEDFPYFYYICLEENIFTERYSETYCDDEHTCNIIVEHDYTTPRFADEMYKR